MKKTFLVAVLAATALSMTGCAAEALTGIAVEKAAQGSAGQPAGPVDALTKAQKQLEEPAYGARVIPEHTTLMSGQDWKVTGGGWTEGAALTVTLTSTTGSKVGKPVHAVADAKGHLDAMLNVPAGTPGGPYKIMVAGPADASGPHSAVVTVFGG